jgi:hypothetical protein
VDTPLKGMTEDCGVAEAVGDSGEAVVPQLAGVALASDPGSSELQASVVRTTVLVRRMDLSSKLLIRAE